MSDLTCMKKDVKKKKRDFRDGKRQNIERKKEEDDRRFFSGGKKLGKGGNDGGGKANKYLESTEQTTCEGKM